MLDARDIARLVREAGLADISLTLAVGSPEGVVSHCQGTWPDGTAIEPTDRFYAASLTKQVTGAAVALLAKNGEVDVDAPLGVYLPELPDWRKDISLRQLLHHTAGLPEAGVLESRISSGHWTNHRALRLLQIVDRLADRPGTIYRYSNVGYICLAEVVKAVSGTSFQQFVRDRLFVPLKLDGAELVAAEAVLDGFPQRQVMGPLLPLSVGDGGLWVSAPTWVQWLDAQNRDALGIARLVEQPGHLNDGSVIDYGWGIGLRTFMSKPLFVHGGSWKGAVVQAARCRDLGISVAVFVASERHAGLGALVDATLHLIAEQRTA